MKHTREELQAWQKLPLDEKIRMTKMRIAQWYRFYDGDVYVSFSGGKDSTVLLDMCREMYDVVDAVHVNTGLEFPEIEKFVNQTENVTVIKPKSTFREVICKYGYPLFSKEVCESVYGARRYLTSILNDVEAFDRQTDRQTDKPPYRYYFEKITGQGKYSKKGSIPSEEELANLLNDRMKNRQGGNNQRLANMLGWRTNDKDNPVKANPTEGELSMFSLEKYKFMLIAPFEISNRCCNVMKKEPLHRFQRESHMNPITAQMASESRLRMQKWLQNGCNAFELKRPISNPMSFWTEQDVLRYIYTKEIPIASVYGDVVIDYDAMGQLEGQLSLADYGWYKEHPILKTTGCTRTGCFACGYGMHCEKCIADSRIQHTIDFSNPKLADWQLRGGHFRKSDGMWEPQGGLGYWFILSWVMKNSNIVYHVPNLDYYVKKYSTEETDRYLKNGD